MTPSPDRDERAYQATRPGGLDDLLPSAPAAAPSPVAATVLKVLVKGFTPTEHRLLNGTVLLSRRRHPQLQLVNDADAELADVVMVDTLDPRAMRWAAAQPWLGRKTVIWIDAKTAAVGHTVARRPVQWPILPMLLARALEQGPSDSTVATSANLDRRRAVLVVDDSLAVRAHLRSLLEPFGLPIDEAETAEAAIAAASNKRYDCILMDVLMPGVDGYEGCRQIKARLSAGSSTAIVMLTSKSSPFDRIRGKMAGCDEYLTKPVEPAHLYDVLGRYLDDIVPEAQAQPALAPTLRTA